MTVAGLIMTAVVLALLLARELLRLPGDGATALRGRRLAYMIPSATLIWGVLVAIRLADYLG